MNQTSQRFMEALRASLNNTVVSWEDTITQQEWLDIFQLAGNHHVLPMIYEAVYACPAFEACSPQIAASIRRQSIQTITTQTMRTAEFGLLIDQLYNLEMTPCVVKGIICRNLYPRPDHRISADEDIWISPDEILRCDRMLNTCGLYAAEAGKDLKEEYEIPYRSDAGMLYIELHKHLFPPESEAYGDLNRFFDGIRDGGTVLHDGPCGFVDVNIDGVTYVTLNPTDHLLYLFLHSFKHFLHSGFGLRQVCDITLFAQRYGADIDWDYVLHCLREVRADLFAISLLTIGEKHLGFDPVKARLSEEWRRSAIDESDMLEDLLAAGIYGQAEMSRRHSSNITLDARIADRRGEAAHSGTLIAAAGSIFLPAQKMPERFAYVRRCKALLPIGWIHRLIVYGIETAKGSYDNNAAASLRIGRERVDLMRKYGIIR